MNVVLLRSPRTIRSTVGHLELSPEQHQTDSGGHEGGRPVATFGPSRSRVQASDRSRSCTCAPGRQRRISAASAHWAAEAVGSRRVTTETSVGVNDRVGVAGTLPDLRLQSLSAVRVIRREVGQRPERDVGEGVHELLEGQHAGRQSLALVVRIRAGRSIRASSAAAGRGGRDCGSAGRRLARDVMRDVLVKAPEGFERDLSGDAQVTGDIEIHGAAVGHDLAATLRRSGIDDGPPVRIGEELERHLIPPVLQRVPSGGLRGRPLRVIRALEFMIAGGVLEQFVQRGRMIVRRAQT